MASMNCSDPLSQNCGLTVDHNIWHPQVKDTGQMETDAYCRHLLEWMTTQCTTSQRKLSVLDLYSKLLLVVVLLLADSDVTQHLFSGVHWRWLLGSRRCSVSRLSQLSFWQAMFAVV